MKRRYTAVLAALVVLLTLTATAAPVTAQSQSAPGNETAGNATDTNSIAGELGTVTVHSVTFHDDGLVKIVVSAEDHSGPIAVTDSGAVDIGSNERASVPFDVYRPSKGTHTLRFHLSSDDQLITIQEGEEMMVASGDRAVVDIITDPTPSTVRWGAVGGGLGVLLAAGLSAGIIKRRHHNTYKELLAEERIRVEEDTVDGVLGTVQSFIRNNKYALLTAATIVAYLVSVRLGLIPSVGAMWSDATDSQRVLAASTAALLVLGFIPAFWVVTRVWDPAKEFVFDVDARDILDAAVGSKGGLQALEEIESAEDAEDAVEDLEKQDITVAAVYSGSPERVRDMQVSGEPAEIATQGGPGHLVQDFDPAKNTAEGTWPGLADDFELARERSKIDSNREILEDYATVGRRIIGALPAIRAGADTSAVQAVDRKFAAATSIDSDPVDDIMDSAVSGTRFERYYSQDTGDSEEEYEDSDENDETVNDNSDGGDSE